VERFKGSDLPRQDEPSIHGSNLFVFPGDLLQMTNVINQAEIPDLLKHSIVAEAKHCLTGKIRNSKKESMRSYYKSVLTHLQGTNLSGLKPIPADSNTHCL
jgi:hypothetical protein